MTETQTATMEPVTNAEAVEFDFFNPSSKQIVRLPEKVNGIDLRGMLEGVIAKSRTEKRAEHTAQIADLTNRLTEAEKLSSRIEELENEKLSATDKVKKEIEREINRAKSETEKHRTDAEKFQTAFKNEKLHNALYKEISKNSKIYNVDQTMKLFNADCMPQLESSGDDWRITANLNGNLLDLSSAFDKWIAQESNSNLLKNNLSPGSGASSNNRVSGSQQNMKRSVFDQLSSSEKMATMAAGVQLQD